MAIKTFTTGEVLTASDTNTYLANSGLVYVASSTFSGSSTVNFDNCFTSAYTNYRIVFNLSGSVSASSAVFQLRNAGSNRATNDYFKAGYYIIYTSGLNTFNASAASSYSAVGVWSANLQSGCSMDIFAPADASVRTNWHATLYDSGAGATYSAGCVYAVTEAQDGFSITPVSGTVSGSITVYGYRKA